jgi:hypothetical protein
MAPFQSVQLLLSQNVEENECRRAHDLAVETYSNSFNKSTPPEEVMCFLCFKLPSSKQFAGKKKKGLVEVKCTLEYSNL